MNTPYIVPQKEKEANLLKELNELTTYHRDHCKEYARLLNLFYPQKKPPTSLNKIPYLPVTLFKTTPLKSIEENETFKILESSGTTSTKKSRIFLDAATAKRQTEALLEIMTPILGDTRIPLLLIESPNVIQNREQYSARGAALVGMMTFGRDITYALNDDMSLNHEVVESFIKKHERLLIFGMTFNVWTHFLLQIKKLPIQKGILMHTGGFKKMQELEVTNETFKETLFQKTGITSCHNFYGMVEQMGTVFIECEKGHLHAPPFGDVIFRDPVTWNESDKGVIQVLSTLPRSYPGHSLLTEDLGYLVATDTCPCGRKGKAFHVTGRVPQAEIRGCSDT